MGIKTFKSKYGVLYFGDSSEILKTFKDQSIDLTITSPPYKNSDNYSDELIHNVFTEVFRIQKDDTLCFVNFGHLAEDKFRPFRVCHILLEIGYKLNDTIVWVKNHYRPLQGRKRLNNLTEFIFLLYKGKMPEIDRLSIGIPYKDKSNIKRWKNTNGKDLKCRGNLWEIPYKTIQNKVEKLHNDRYPTGLPEMCMKLSSSFSVVIDPFMGSGTTAVVAEKMEKNWVGIEIDKGNFDITCERINEINSTDLFFE